MSIQDELDWEEYHDVGGATPSMITSAEEALGIRFPDDLKQLLQTHQGMSIDSWGPSSIKIFDSPPHPHFESLMHLHPEKYDDTNIVYRTLKNWRDGVPKTLVTFARGGSQSYFVLDYEEAPPSVVMMSGGLDAEEWRGCTRPKAKIYNITRDDDLRLDPMVGFVVANSVTELLEALETAEE